MFRQLKFHPQVLEQLEARIVPAAITTGLTVATAIGPLIAGDATTQDGTDTADSDAVSSAVVTSTSNQSSGSTLSSIQSNSPTVGQVSNATASILPQSPPGGLGGIFNFVNTSGAVTTLGVSILVTNSGTTPLLGNILGAGGSASGAGGGGQFSSTGVGAGGFGYGFSTSTATPAGTSATGAARGTSSAGAGASFIGGGSGASSSFSGATGTGLSAGFSGSTGAGGGFSVSSNTTSVTDIGTANASTSGGPAGVTSYVAPGASTSSGVTGYTRQNTDSNAPYRLGLGTSMPQGYVSPKPVTPRASQSSQSMQSPQR